MKIKRIHNLTPAELNQIINLHYSNLDESFLNNFGKKFLQICYHVIIKGKNNICLVLKDHSKIIGFLIATLDGQKFNNEVISQCFLLLSWEIIKASLRKPQLIIKLISWKIKKTIPTKIKPEILFIVVNPKFQGIGLGTKLIKTLGKELSANNILQYRVGTKTDNLLSHSFYRKLGFRLAYKDNFFGDNFNYYYSPKF